MGAVNEYYHHREIDRFDDRVFDEWKMETYEQKFKDYFKKKGIK